MDWQRSAPAALRSLERQATNRHTPQHPQCRRPASSPVGPPLPQDKGQDSGPVLLSTRGTVVEMSYSPEEFNHQTVDARCRRKSSTRLESETSSSASEPTRFGVIRSRVSLDGLLRSSPRYSLNSLRGCVKDRAG